MKSYEETREHFCKRLLERQGIEITFDQYDELTKPEYIAKNYSPAFWVSRKKTIGYLQWHPTGEAISHHSIVMYAYGRLTTVYPKEIRSDDIECFKACFGRKWFQAALMIYSTYVRELEEFQAQSQFFRYQEVVFEESIKVSDLYKPVCQFIFHEKNYVFGELMIRHWKDFYDLAPVVTSFDIARSIKRVFFSGDEYIIYRTHHRLNKKDIVIEKTDDGVFTTIPERGDIQDGTVLGFGHTTKRAIRSIKKVLKVAKLSSHQVRIAKERLEIEKELGIKTK